MDEVVTEFSPKEGAGTVSDRLSDIAKDNSAKNISLPAAKFSNLFATHCIKN